MRNEKLDLLMYLMENGCNLPKKTIEENMKAVTMEEALEMFNTLMGE